MSEKAKVNIDAKLGVDKFSVDEDSAHIRARLDHPDPAELERLVKLCPAGLYKFDKNGSFRFDYLGCLECGTCRVLSLGKAVESWSYPRGTFGIDYRFG